MRAIEIRIFQLENGAYIPRLITYKAASMSFTEGTFRYGTFRINFPVREFGANEFQKYRLILIDKYYSGIIENVTYTTNNDGEFMEITGKELKGVLSYKITIPPTFTTIKGLAGYDAITGDTETCIKHFWKNNIGSGTLESRRISAAVIAPNLHRGKQGDKYMSRFDNLSEVTAELAEDSKLVVKADFNAENGITFDVSEPTDRTSEQIVNSPVVLSLSRKTILQMVYTNELSGSYNAFYATRSGAQFADEALTLLYTRESEAEPSGIARREKHLNVSIKTPIAGDEYEDMKFQVQHDMTNYEEVKTLNAQINFAQLEYRRDYNLGDIVTVYNKDWNIMTDVQITAIERNISANNEITTVTLGTRKKGLLRQIRTEINNI